MNPFFTKLTGILPKSINLKDIKNAYYLGGLASRDIDIASVKNAILANKLEAFLTDFKYDTQEDNFEIYLIEDKTNRRQIVIILDPFELYSREHILDIFPIGDEFSLSAPQSEKIYPS